MKMNERQIMVLLAILVFLTGFVISVVKNKKTKRFIVPETFNALAVVVMGAILGYLWIKYGRPPMRSIGETRLWYAFFLPLIGGITYRIWSYRWFLSYSLFMGMMFLAINIFSPDVYARHLPPALQSAWFVPHVIVYILGYSLLAAPAIIGLHHLIVKNKTNHHGIADKADKMVYAGFVMITFGLLFGALWAKVAWGDYWSWDPKETWALISWLFYLTYIHCRIRSKPLLTGKNAFLFLIVAFLILLITWMGIKFLPTGSESIHIYG
jgi:ABC-type transport system involved in cytochrome c biogenesis permease subunit